MFSKTLEDQLNRSTLINYQNAVSIGGVIAFAYLDTVTRQPLPAKDCFSFNSISGNFQESPINTDLSINFRYKETPLTYEFIGGIICKKKGIYSFKVSDLLSPGLKGNNCTKATFSMFVSNTEKHLYLHQYALNIDSNSQSLQQAVYDFRVN